MAKLNLGQLIDQAYTLRAERLEYQREVEAKLTAMKEAEERVHKIIIEKFSDAEIASARGSVATATSTLFVAPQVEDWGKLYAFIKKTGSFELLERRPSRSACAERWDAGKTIPGVKQFTAKRLSLTKIGEKK